MSRIQSYQPHPLTSHNQSTTTSGMHETEQHENQPAHVFLRGKLSSIFTLMTSTKKYIYSDMIMMVMVITSTRHQHCYSRFSRF